MSRRCRALPFPRLAFLNNRCATPPKAVRTRMGNQMNSPMPSSVLATIAVAIPVVVLQIMLACTARLRLIDRVAPPLMTLAATTGFIWTYTLSQTPWAKEHGHPGDLSDYMATAGVIIVAAIGIGLISPSLDCPEFHWVRL